MTDTNDSNMTQYVMNEDYLFLHGSKFARCGNNANLYVLLGSDRSGFSMLGVQRIEGYWFLGDYLIIDMPNPMSRTRTRYVRSYDYNSMDTTKYISISQAAEQLIKILKEEDEWYEQLTAK